MQESEFFFKDDRLPYVEIRYTKNSSKHYKEHLHETFSIGTIDKGEVLYKVRDKEAFLKPGSLALIPPFALHCCNPVNNQKRSYYMLYLDKEFVTQLQSSLFETNSFVAPNDIILNDTNLYQKYLQLLKLFIKDSFILEKEQKLIYGHL